MRLRGDLLVVSDSLVREHGGRLYLQGGLGRHIDAFAARFDTLTLLTCSRRVEQRPDEYCLQSSNIRLVPVRPISSRARVGRYVSMLLTMAHAALVLPRTMRAGDCIHCRLPSSVGSVGALFARFVSKPVFIYMSTDWQAALESKGHDHLARFVQRVLVFLVDDFLCFTAGQDLAGKYGGPNHRVIPVMTTAIDESHILPLQEAVNRVARPPSEVLFVGAVWSMKGVHILLDAVRMVRERGLNLRLRIVGGSSDGGKWLRDNIESRGLNDIVKHHQHMAWDRLMSEYEKSDIFVMPSLEGRGETGPKVVLEAMARGVPVVASRVGFVPRVIRHLDNGWIVSPGRADEIADAIIGLSEAEELRKRFAANGIRTAAQFGIDDVIDSMTEKIRELTTTEKDIAA